MRSIRRFILVVAIMWSCIGCDQYSKHIVREELSGSIRYSYFHDVFRLELSENSGAFLSLGATLPEQWRFWIFTAGVGIFLLLLLAYTVVSRELSRIEILAFSLMLGGGASNLIDRALRNGQVTDFLNTGIGSLRTGIFNIADFAITVGVLLLIFQALSTMIRRRSQTASRSGRH